MLKGKHILLGVTGSIAAYKSAMLVRNLVKQGAEVKVVMTEMAKQFITPLTMATLSKNPILVDFYNPENGDWNSHVSLGMWADLYLIAPCSANTIGKMVSGVADNLLLTSYLSAKCKVAIAPAMDLDMYRLASGLEGKGRMAEPEDIVLQVESIFAREGSMKGKKVLVTAGPTREPIDPVRYISNHSSGKMAYALAREAALRGADVTVVSGPVNIKMASHSVKVVNVNTAAEMFQATKEHTPDADVVILCAAVADFTVAQVTDKKIKREKSNYNLELTPTNDIAAWVGENRGKDTIAVGFALETNDEEQNAAAKLSKKKLDMIVLNSMRDSGAGFGHDTNKVTLFFKDGDPVALPLKSKGEVAADIVDNIEKLM